MPKQKSEFVVLQDGYEFRVYDDEARLGDPAHLIATLKCPTGASRPRDWLVANATAEMKAQGFRFL
jgi:hypothetical protein